MSLTIFSAHLEAPEDERLCFHTSQGLDDTRTSQVQNYPFATFPAEEDLLFRSFSSTRSNPIHEHEDIHCCSSSSVACTGTVHNPINPIDEEDFKCSICLNLWHKPCMSSCGHIFCFWCIQLAMNGVGPSQCPLCRSPYAHFPSVCLPLHHLVVKNFPEESHERELETTIEETRIGVQSPSIPNPAMNTTMEEDFACVQCHKLAYEPMVPSCGHVFCKSCLTAPGANPSGVCPAPNCTVHIKVPTNICIVLHDVLNNCMPSLYAARAAEVQAGTGQRQIGPPKPFAPFGIAAAPTTSQEQPATPLSPWAPLGDAFGVLQDPDFVHYGIICDGCGAYPIVGERWRCRDCPEKIGFDICGECHGRRVHHQMHTGKFNQTHCPTHHMELVEQVQDWLHQFKALHPELTMDQLWNLVCMALQQTQNPEPAGESWNPMDAPAEDEGLTIDDIAPEATEEQLELEPTEDPGVAPTTETDATQPEHELPTPQ